MARKKIALIGAGNIGGELASQLVSKQLGDVVLFDIPQKEGFAKGKALDLEQLSALSGNDARVTGSSNWSDCAGADVLIITAGIPRKPGQSRDDLVATNLPIIRAVADNAKKHCPSAFCIVVSNPLDAMVYEFQRRTGFASAKVAGMAGALDSARYQLFLAREAGVSVKDVRCLVLGGHGDDMVPIGSATTINGIPVDRLIAKDKLEAIITRTRGGGGEIVGLMGTSAYYAPGRVRLRWRRPICWIRSVCSPVRPCSMASTVTVTFTSACRSWWARAVSRRSWTSSSARMKRRLSRRALRASARWSKS